MRSLPFCFLPQGKFRHLHSRPLDTGIESENMSTVACHGAYHIPAFAKYFFMMEIMEFGNLLMHGNNINR